MRSRPNVPIPPVTHTDAPIHRRLLANACRWLIPNVIDLFPNAAALGSSAAPLVIDTTLRDVVNWGAVIYSYHHVTIPNKATGVITFPRQGFYDVFAMVTGTQGNATSGQDFELYVRHSQFGDLLVDNKFVDPSAPNANRTLMGYSIGDSQAGDTIKLGMRGTAALGTFTFTDAVLVVTEVGRGMTVE